MNRISISLTLALALLAACSAPAEQDPIDPVPAEPVPDLEIIALEHVDADELAAILGDFAADAAGVTGAEPDVKILADPRTNSLLVMAPDARMSELKALVAQLDVEGGSMAPR